MFLFGVTVVLHTNLPPDAVISIIFAYLDHRAPHSTLVNIYNQLHSYKHLCL